MKNLYCGSPEEIKCEHRDEITQRCNQKKQCGNSIDADKNPEAVIRILGELTGEGVHAEMIKVNKILDSKTEPEGEMAEEKKKRKYTRSGKYSKAGKPGRPASEPIPVEKDEIVIMHTKTGKFVGAYDKEGNELKTIRIKINEIPA